MRPKLVVFDVDGTLVDSQTHIHGAMAVAFAAIDRAAPPLAEVRAIVGLSLPQAVLALAPDLEAVAVDRAVAAYKDSFATTRAQNDGAPLYDGVLDMLALLSARDDLILGIATGKSRRGLRHMLDQHDLHGHFFTRQVADDHPSKPHPSMLLAASAETGVAPQDAVMIGDTVFDLQMARAAGMPAIAVDWGYHGRERLEGETPAAYAETVADLPGLINAILGR
ncbi:MAG: HAD-IA family hydrolase [Qingshengfaniella sp.]